MGNWTDRFDPETVDEIKRYEVGEGDWEYDRKGGYVYCSFS